MRVKDYMSKEPLLFKTSMGFGEVVRIFYGHRFDMYPVDEGLRAIDFDTLPLVDHCLL